VSEPFNQNERAFGDPIAAAKYDKQIFDAWQNQLHRAAGRTTGLSILELGPGVSLGSQILLSERGNRVTVADLYPCQWHANFHPAAYSHLAELMGGSAHLDDAAQSGQVNGGTVRQIADAAESLSNCADGEFDVVLSNAVLEHIRDPDKVCAELARVTKPGGVNVHQIDLGYHKKRQAPLDHLLLTEEEFLAEADAAHFEYGNRWRASEFIARFQRNEFAVDLAHVTQRAEVLYLAAIMRQLRNSRSNYRNWPEDDVGILSIMLSTRRLFGFDANQEKAKGMSTLVQHRALKQVS
jgi:SAM-dependent methyltransferase